jgi:hypothetical protein
LIDPAQDLRCTIVRPAVRADKLQHLWFGETQERCHGAGKGHGQIGNIILKLGAYHSGTHAAYGYVRHRS